MDFWMAGTIQVCWVGAFVPTQDHLFPFHEGFLHVWQSASKS